MTTTARTISDRLLDDDTALRLTLLVLLLRPPGEGMLRGLTWLAAGLAFVFPPLLRSGWTWLCLAALVAARLIADWPVSDNHIYLLAYWTLGLGLCLLVPQPRAAVASMSRWLVGTAFVCAVLWKGALAPDFLDARFFRVTLVTDERFEDLARAVGGLSENDMLANRAALVALPAGMEVIDGPVLTEPAALRRLGLSLTWGGFLLESLIALAFLSPWPASLHRARHWLLITFAGVTYAVAPVAGFGWLLVAMGLAQCGPDQPRARVAYLIAFALIFLYAETPLVHMALTQWAPR